jgi:histidinol-phosphate aminotransferase
MLERARAIGFIVPDSHANFIWCTHPTWNLKEMYQKLKDQRVLVRYMDYPEWGAGLRISVGTDAQSDACMDLLESMR